MRKWRCKEYFDSLLIIATGVGEHLKKIFLYIIDIIKQEDINSISLYQLKRYDNYDWTCKWEEIKGGRGVI